MIYWIWLYLTGRTSMFAFRQYVKYIDSLVWIFLTDYTLDSCGLEYDEDKEENWVVFEFKEGTKLKCLLTHSGTIAPSFKFYTMLSESTWSGYPSGANLVALHTLVDEYLKVEQFTFILVVYIIESVLIKEEMK